MTPGQLERLAFIRTHLALLCADLRASRDAAEPGNKAPFRRANNRLGHADAQLRFAEQDAANGR